MLSGGLLQASAADGLRGSQARDARRSYDALVRDLSAPNGLFRDSDGNYAQAWPFSQVLAAAISIAKLPGEAGERSEVRRLVDLLPSYLDSKAYESTPRPPTGGGGIRFFDDNEWLALDLVDASKLLHDPSLLAQAAHVFDWIATGWDTNAADACSGGVFWANTPKIQVRNSVSTANGAVLALELYSATGKPVYLVWGRRMFAWVQRCLTDTDGLLFDHIDGKGHVNQAKWSYNQGAMVAAAALLYEATHRPSYLHYADSLSSASLGYFEGDQYQGQPAIFAAIYFRYLDLLDHVHGEKQVNAYLSRYVTLHERSAPSSGSELLDRAASVQLSAELAGA